MNTKNGDIQNMPPFSVSDHKSVQFTPPDSATDWVLLVKGK